MMEKPWKGGQNHMVAAQWEEEEVEEEEEVVVVVVVPQRLLCQPENTFSVNSAELSKAVLLKVGIARGTAK